MRLHQLLEGGNIARQVALDEGGVRLGPVGHMQDANGQRSR
jgi:hypothetical protein